MRSVLALASSVLALVSSIAPALGQSACLDFAPTFASATPDELVHAQIVYDDGSGPALYVGGAFTTIGDASASRVARWDGTSWEEVGGGMNADVRAFAVWDDGDGPRLYAGGSFTLAGGATARRIASWDGQQWTEVGGGIGIGHVHALASFDDGTGSALYVAGNIRILPQDIRTMARWDGGSWSGVGNLFVEGLVRSLVVHDDGGPDGERLFAGGGFTISFWSIMGLAAYDHGSWSVPGGEPRAPVFGNVLDLCVYDDGLGGGERLWVAGTPQPASGLSSRLGVWDGAAWSEPAGVVAETPTALGVHAEAGGDVLVACGAFTSIAGTSAHHVARWDGTQWRPLAGGLEGWGQSLAAFGGLLFVSATLIPSGNASFDVWDGAAWSTMPGGGQGLEDEVFVLHVHDDGGGQALYAGGEFEHAGTIAAERVARWDGHAWSALGAGVEDGVVLAMESFDAGAGPELYVGGLFTVAGGTPASNLARWNGAAWVPMPGTPPGQDVQAFAVHDDGSGPAIYVAGRFQSIGGVASSGVARWDGTAFSAVGGGLPVWFSFGVLALASFDDGGGPKLYAGGNFTSAHGATPGDYLVRWNGTNWEALPASDALLSHVGALAVGSVGGVSRLLVGGSIAIGGGPVDRLAAWDGTTWTALGSALDGFVSSIATHDDGTGFGPALYIGGQFAHAGGVVAPGLARWDGSTWSAVGDGLSGGEPTTIGRALASFDDGEGSGSDLYVGGRFATAGSLVSAHLARWEGCGETGVPLCFGDGTLATACPCANAGDAGRGCANSQAPEGALLEAAGVASDDSVVLAASAMHSANTCIFLQGSGLSTQGVVFGDGVRCASGQLLRLAVKSVQAGSATYPGAGDPSILERNVELGSPITHPSQRIYQTYYRDSSLAFCPEGGTFNVTNGVKIVW